jgi:hypothetical protein
MLSHFRSATGGPNPLALDWTDPYNAMLVDNDKDITEAMKQLSSCVAQFGTYQRNKVFSRLALMRTDRATITPGPKRIPPVQGSL